MCYSYQEDCYLNDPSRICVKLCVVLKIISLLNTHVTAVDVNYSKFLAIAI